MALQSYKVGDVFLVPLDESCEDTLGQVIAVEPDALHSVACAFWTGLDEDSESQLSSTPVAVLLVTPDLLKAGAWKIVGNSSVLVPTTQRPYEQYRKSQRVGAKIIGAGIVREFLRACLGLRNWDDWADPAYLNGLLLPGVSVPARAKYGKDS